MRPGADLRLRPRALRATPDFELGSRGGRPSLTGLAAVSLFAALLAACNSSRQTVIVGCQDTPEQLIVGNLIALVAEKNPKVTVERRFNMGGPDTCFSALKKGEIDVCAEYSHTVLTEFLRQPAKRDRQAAYERVKSLLDARYGVACLPPLGFSNGRVLLLREETAKKSRIAAISDLRTHRGRLKSAFTREFLEDENGYPAMCAAYGFAFSDPPKIMNQKSLYWSLSVGKADVVSGFNMDAAISAGGLTVLEDDLKLFTSGDACLLVRRSLIEREPSLDFTLQKLSHVLDDKTMRALKVSLKRGQSEPADVARDFLRSRGILR